MADILQLANQFRAELLNNERHAAVRLTQAYDVIWRRLYRKLTTINQQIEDARARGEAVNQAWLFRQERYGALPRQVDREFRRFAEIATTSITRQQSGAVNAAIGNSVELMNAAAEEASVTATFNRLPTAAVENLVGFLGNGSPLRSLIDRLPAHARRVIEDGLIQAVTLGISPRETARRIREGLGGNLTRALTIARTETARAYNTATSQSYKQNSDIVDGWYWRSARGRRSCAACIALDGTFHSVNEPMKSHPNCRCVMIPAVEGVQVDKGADWFARQPAQVQKDIIGTEAGYQAYKDGELKIEDFVGLTRNPQWGDSYHQLSVKRARAGENRFPGDAARPRDIIPPIFQPPAAPSRAEQSLLDFARSTPRDVTVEYDSLGRDAVRRIFGRQLSDEELANAVGAFDGSLLRVTEIGGGAYVRLEHEWMEMHERTITRDREGVKISNDYFIKNSGAPAGLAARSFGRQIFGAARQGIKEIKTFAAGWLGHPVFVGYHTWPNMGYNAPLSPADIRDLPPELRGARDLQDLFDLPGGSEWWRTYGQGQDMIFDLDERSKSMRRFFIYLADKQRRL